MGKITIDGKDITKEFIGIDGKKITKITIDSKDLTLKPPLIDINETMPKTTREIDNANVKWVNQYKDNQDDNLGGLDNNTKVAQGNTTASAGSFHWLVRNSRNDNYKKLHWGWTQVIKDYKSYDNFTMKFIVRAMYNYSTSDQSSASIATNHMDDYLWGTSGRSKTLNDPTFTLTNETKKTVRVDNWEISGQRQADGSMLITSKNANHIAQNASASLPFQQNIKFIQGSNGGNYALMYGEGGSHTNPKSLSSLFNGADAYGQTDLQTANDFTFYVVPWFTQVSGQDGLFLSISDFVFTGQKDN